MADDYKAKYERLLNQVRQMRGWQKEWYKYHVRSDLEKAKHWEKEVDKTIAAEVKVKESNQKELF